MFSGVFQHSIDAKGRTSLPARFRELLAAQNAEKLFVTTDLLDPCLVCFAPAQWQAFAEKVAARGIFDTKARLLTRGFIAPAQECPVDKLGRILIPASLREHAGLGEEITWAGSTGRIEVWSPLRWAEVQSAVRKPESIIEMAKELSGLGL